ncbi:hypothetical protein AB0I94_28845 [Streptomyces sp. NPDC050147]|uniref:hypothetical protein n=1 Tax=Streptomyces sp. NPDC050147 TaxID=3155513 RepID=UPI0034493B10
MTGQPDPHLLVVVPREFREALPGQAGPARRDPAQHRLPPDVAQAANQSADG